MANTGDDEEDEEGENPQLSRVSLSGLLNAIDGVAAPEGHILVMTTNKPEKLDDALVRSGRISVKVGFEKAAGEQARDIFMRMYCREEKESEMDGSEKGGQAKTGGHTHLEELARQFGKLVPDHVFSPADLQDFLLTRRKDPQRAIDELDEWKVRMVEEWAKKAEDEANRRKEKAEMTKRKMAEVMATSGETQSALQAGAVQSGSSTTKDKVKEASEESTATAAVEEAAQV